MIIIKVQIVVIVVKKQIQHYENYLSRKILTSQVKIKPMLATPIDKAFDSKEWVFEIKWDGVRAILFLNKKNEAKPLIELSSRSGNSITHSTRDNRIARFN